MDTISHNTKCNESYFHAFAAAYARNCNMQVFPLTPRTKKPITKHGFLDASKDASVISDWWKNHPFANIGCATGLASGVSVLDIDAKPNAELILQEFERKHSKLPKTPTAISGGGGFHFYYKSSFTLPCRVKIIHGVDFRADGGYIVLPPSIHENGQHYIWKNGYSINDLPFADIPAWLVELVRRPVENGAGISGGLFKDITETGVEDGRRNVTMTSVIGHLLAKDVDLNLVKELVLSLNQTRFIPPLDQNVVLKILDSISKRELDKRMKWASK